MASALPTPGSCCDDCGCEGEITISNTIGWFQADTLADMRAISSNALNKVVNLAGEFTQADGGEGVYNWDNNSVAADNFPTVVEPDDAPAAGRWLKML